MNVPLKQAPPQPSYERLAKTDENESDHPMVSQAQYPEPAFESYYAAQVKKMNMPVGVD